MSEYDDKMLELRESLPQGSTIDKRSEADQELYDQVLAALTPVGIKGITTITEQQSGKKKPTRHAVTAGTSTNVPEADGESVRSRQETGAGSRGKQSSDVLLQSKTGGGDAGYVGVSTLGGKMKYKAASTSPEGEATTGFINPFRAKRARRAIEATPSIDWDPNEFSDLENEQ